MMKKWYEPLIEDQWVDFFDTPDFRVEDPGFKGFSELVLWMTLGMSIVSFFDDKRALVLNNLPAEGYEICKNLGDSCNWKEVDFKNLFRTGIDLYINNEYEKMNAEQIAVQLMYPFWSRADGSFEESFAKSGRLRETLLELKRKYEQMR